MALRRYSIPTSGPRSGFSLVELSIVVVILGVLAMMGVPRYQQVVERSKAVEAFTYMQHIAKGQEMYQARHGRYADRVSKLGLKVSLPENFSSSQITSINWETAWQLRLIRSGPSSGFGNYTVTWNQNGFVASRSSVSAKIAPNGVGGKLKAESGGRRDPNAPTGALKWSSDKKLTFEEYRDRMFKANYADYKKSDDPLLQTVVWFINILENWTMGRNETQEETTKRFFGMKKKDYEEGESPWMDFILTWHYSNTAARNGWN